MNDSDARKLMLGTLLVGASALPAGNLIAGLLSDVGKSWASEAVRGATGAGPSPGSALTAAFVRAIQAGVSGLRREYGAERLGRDGKDAFDLLRQIARGVTVIEMPSVSDGDDIVAVQRGFSGALATVLSGFPDAQVRLLRVSLLPATARAFHEELSRDATAWRLYHGWLFARMATQSTALRAAFVNRPTVWASLVNPVALEDHLDAFSARLDSLLVELRDNLRAAALGADSDLSAWEGSDDYGLFNEVGARRPLTVPYGRRRGE